MKKRLLFITMLVFLFVLVACVPPVTKDQKPVIHGAVDRTINRGDVFKPLEGITATDEEDGDLTEDIIYTGNVNPNVVGTYEATYTVTDSYGNITMVTVEIKVVLVDEDAPILSGVANKTIYLGDPTFTILEGVSADDTVDGNLTSEIVTTGEVDIWTVGTYTVNYEVEDNSGNKTSHDRVITVSLGAVTFDEVNVLSQDPDDWKVTDAILDGYKVSTNANGVLEFLSVSGGEINEDIHPFTFAKLAVKAKADKNVTVTVSLEGTTSANKPINVTTSLEEYLIYFRLEEPLEDAKLTFTFLDEAEIEFEDLELVFGGAKDDVAPVLTIPDYDLVGPIDDEDALTFIALRGVTASDDVDGNITKNIIVDTSEVDFSVGGEYQITYLISDKAGNETTETRNVTLMTVYDTGFIKDPGFDGDELGDQWGFNEGAGVVPVFKVEDGVMVHYVGSQAQWASASSPEIKGLSTNVLHKENWYMLKFDVKAERDRQMVIRSGLALNGDPWIEDFLPEIKASYKLTSEWQTIYYIFYVPTDKSEDGRDVIKVEIQLGTFTWSSSEVNNPVNIDNFQYYLLTNVNNEPVISAVKGKATAFVKDSTLPDFKEYVTINDVEDGNIVVTEEMVDASAVDITKAGDYVVVYTVTDSGGATTTYSLNVKVLEEADEEAPEIIESADIKVEFDQFSDEIVDFKTYVTATDNVDGEIIITDEMIDKGDFNLNKAGEYTITFTVFDSSLNENTLEIEVIVNDKEGPVVNVEDLVITLNSTFNPTNVLVVDNVDGLIVITEDDITGLDAFMTDGVITELGTFEITYKVKDEALNETEVTVTIEIVDFEFSEDKAIDLLALELPAGNDGEPKSSVVYEDGLAEFTYAGPAWWASAAKLKYVNIELTKDAYYRFVFEAKAEEARDMLIYFTDPDGNKVKGFDNKNTGEKRFIALGEEYQVFEYIFKAPKSGMYLMEIHFGWEGFLRNADSSNTITIRQLKLVPEKQEGDVDPEPLPNVILVEDFEGYEDDEAIRSAYLHRRENKDWGTYKNYFWLSETGGAEGSKALKIDINSGYGLDAVKPKTAFSIEELTDDYEYFVFWIKPDAYFIEKGLEVRLYKTGANYPINVDISYLSEEGGWVVVKIADFGYMPSEIIQYAIGYNEWDGDKNRTVYIDNIMFVIDPSEFIEEEPEEPLFEFDHVLIDSFENYETTLDVQGKYTFVHTSNPVAGERVELLFNEGYEESQGVELQVAGSGDYKEGWNILKTKGFDNSNVSDDYEYFAFWFKGKTSKNKIGVWMYWGDNKGDKEIMLPEDSEDGVWLYIKLSDWGITATEVTDFGVGYNNWDYKSYNLQFDNFMFIKNPEDLPNTTN